MLVALDHVLVIEFLRSSLVPGLLTVGPSHGNSMSVRKYLIIINGRNLSRNGYGLPPADFDWEHAIAYW